jgi:hypothetical protein
MDTRTTAIYDAFFLLIAVGAYLLLPVAEGERAAGLWGVVILSMLTVIVLTGLSLMPTTR